MSGDSEGDAAALTRVLVVDDSRLQRKILTAMLKRWGFDVVQAESGEEALDICQTAPPDLVLSDWMMPGMDGLEFCQKFRALDRETYGYFILLTSKSDKAEIARGLDAGADDFLTKPVNGDELRARITAGTRVLSMEQELNRKNRLITETLAELRQIHDAIDKDLMQARKIQDSLVPDLVRDYGAGRVSMLLKPCGHVGGDLVGTFSPGEGRIGFYGIDVSGHGITSAMMTARVAGYLNSRYLDQNIALEQKFERFYAMLEPQDVARLLNDRLTNDAGVVEYFTMVFATVDLDVGHVRMVQAGHPHPLVLRADGRAEFLGDGGVPVGLVSGVDYAGFETYVSPGDRILIYSDGFTECVMANGEMLEPEGLLDLVSAVPPGTDGQEFLDDLYWRLSQTMAPDARFDDDVSAVLFEYNGK